jgi:uncharacterized repeat protein (TIGR03803 family)
MRWRRRQGNGAVSKLSPSGRETVLYSFTGATDGNSPFAGLLRGRWGNLYGTTNSGGTHGDGVVFKLSPSGTETVLYSFRGGADGRLPQGTLISDPSGNLYGTASRGGNFAGNCGANLGLGCGVVSDDVGYRFTRLGKNEATTRASVKTIITAQVTQAMVLNSRELR